MMIKIFAPGFCVQEYHWVLRVIFQDFFGIDFVVEETDNIGFVLERNGKRLEMPNNFFRQACVAWLQTESLPSLPLATMTVEVLDIDVPLVNFPLPILFGAPEFKIEKDRIQLGVDIFGSVFFMLSRYEEAVLSDRDCHDRFPAAASVAVKANFLDRPIVDEYLEILWASMGCLWPDLIRKEHTSRKFISCDVDSPYVGGPNSLGSLIRKVGGDMVRRRSFALAHGTYARYIQQRSGDFSDDPNLKAFDWMMDVNEKAGNKVAFYFITQHSHPNYDGCYSMNQPVIRDLIKRIAERGHEVGLHGSYNTYQDASQLQYEVDILRRVLDEEKIVQSEIGGRQHCLRWETPTTAVILDSAKMSYDTTLSYADRLGFRCGTCHEYSMYDVLGRRPLKLKQRPLVMMEVSVFAERYMGLDYREETLDMLLNYKSICKNFGGNFTLLWHNSNFQRLEDIKYYEALIQ
jgi:peptidoglycan/xylan/chitin deacetylase (PgdA/CDA1 family)